MAKAAGGEGHRNAFTTRRRDPENKREAVLQTAAQLFLEKSYRRTSMNDVAARLSITKPALYHYFRNKEEILLGCYRWGTAWIGDSLREISNRCGTGLERVEAFIHVYTNVMTVNFGRCVMRLDEGDLSPEARAEVRTYKRRIDRTLRSYIEQGIADGSIEPCDSKIAAFAIAGAMNALCMWYKPEGALAPPDIAAQIAKTLTRGISREGPRAPDGRGEKIPVPPAGGLQSAQPDTSGTNVRRTGQGRGGQTWQPAKSN